MTGGKKMKPAIQASTPRYEDYAAPLHMIHRAPYFSVRGGEIDEGHARALAQRIREIGPLDPVLLWQDKQGFAILDGEHRMAAYRKAGWTDTVPARIVECDRRAALLLAFQANSKATLALTNSERWNLAWRLVRHPHVDDDWAFTKSQVNHSTGVSTGTVDNMRKRLNELQQGGREPTGNWISDRRGDTAADWNGPDEAVREAMIEDKARALRKVFDVKGTRDDHVLSEALLRAVGDVRLSHWFDYLYGGHNDDADYGDEGGDDDEVDPDF